MKKSDAIKRVYDNMEYIHDDLDISEDQIEDIIDYLVSVIGMLPPLHELDNFPGMYDNGWES